MFLFDGTKIFITNAYKKKSNKMPKGTTFKNDVLLLFLENANIATLGDATGVRGSTTPGDIFIGLHTADPNAGDQQTSEATYTGYARKSIARTAGAWTTAAGASENTAAITFAQCTAGSDTITHFSMGVASSGASLLLYSGTCSLSVSSGITPEFAVGALDLTEA